MIFHHGYNRAAFVRNRINYWWITQQFMHPLISITSVAGGADVSDTAPSKWQRRRRINM